MARWKANGRLRTRSVPTISAGNAQECKHRRILLVILRSLCKELTLRHLCFCFCRFFRSTAFHIGIFKKDPGGTFAMARWEANGLLRTCFAQPISTGKTRECKKRCFRLVMLCFASILTLRSALHKAATVATAFRE